MDKVCGLIKQYSYENRTILIVYKKRNCYFHLTRGLIRKFHNYLVPGVYIFFRISGLRHNCNQYYAYDIVNIEKIINHRGKKTISYYDIDNIKSGVKKLLKKDTYKMFIDLEFSMPSYEHMRGVNDGFYSEIIQYGICLEDPNGKLVNETYGLLRPKCKYGITDRTVEFLNVPKDEFSNAPYYSRFYQILNDYMSYYQPTIYIWGKNDYLMIEDSYIQNNVLPITSRKNFINLMQVMKNYYNRKEDIGLYSAYSIFKKDPPMVEQDHNALHDAQATLEIYHLFEKEVNS